MNELAMTTEAAGVSDRSLSPVPSSGWVVKHQLTGRVRLQNSRLRGNDALAKGVQKTLRALPGVQDVEVSAALGTVLVLYDESAQSLPSLLGAIGTAHPLPVKRDSTKKRQVKKSEGKDGKQDASWMAHAAHGLKEFAVSLNDGVKKNTGGKVELRQIVLSFLLARIGLQAGRAGVAAWETIENAVEFIIAYTLYHHPDVEKEVKDAEDVVNPGL